MANPAPNQYEIPLAKSSPAFKFSSGTRNDFITAQNENNGPAKYNVSMDIAERSKKSSKHKKNSLSAAVSASSQFSRIGSTAPSSIENRSA